MCQPANKSENALGVASGCTGCLTNQVLLIVFHRGLEGRCRSDEQKCGSIRLSSFPQRTMMQILNAAALP